MHIKHQLSAMHTAPFSLQLSHCPALPPELLPHLLAGLSAADLAHAAATCSALAHAVMWDPSADATLWAPACRARWATKALDPALVYPEMLKGLSHR